MTDKHDGLLDAAQQAVRMERLEGQQNLLAARVSSGMENVANSLASVQSEVRTISGKLSDLGNLQHSHETNKVSIEEVKKGLLDLNVRLTKWFDDFEDRSQRRWERFEQDRNEWRREHEAENEDTKRQLEREIRSVRETVIRFVGFGSAVGALAGVVIGGFIWSINYRFNEGRDDIAETRAVTTQNRAKVEEVQGELSDVKLYLARGGRIPVEPYVPPAQRKRDGQSTAPR